MSESKIVPFPPRQLTVEQARQHFHEFADMLAAAQHPDAGAFLLAAKALDSVRCTCNDTGETGASNVTELRADSATRVDR